MVFICRLCSKYELTSSGLAIFSEIGINRSLAYKIKLAVDVVVSQDDPLPKYVCKYCLGKLEETFSFQESCRRAQLHLRDYFLRGSAQLEENGDVSFEGVRDDNDLSSGVSACDTTALSTSIEVEPDVCQGLIPQLSLSVLNTEESTNHLNEAEQANAIVPEITSVSTNGNTSLLPYNSTSHSTFKSDTVIQDNGVLNSSTQDGTAVDASTLEISIKEEEVDLGYDYYEAEGNVNTNSKDINHRLQNVITNVLPTKSKTANAHPKVPETTKTLESVVTEKASSSSKANACGSSNVTACGSSNVTACGSFNMTASGSFNVTACGSPYVTRSSKVTTRGCRDAIPGTSQDDDIYVVEIVKANKTSVAQYWERYESQFRCKKCFKVFLRKGKCESHIRTHLGVKPHECHICKQRFRKKRMLNEHNFVHSGKKVYHCVFCSKAFRYKNNFQKHTEKHTEPPAANHMCDHCGKVFDSQWKYWQHKVSKHLLVKTDIVVK